MHSYGRIDRTDSLFSRFIRLRDGKCAYGVVCGSQATQWAFEELQCSHYHGRGKWSVRFDAENADAACYSCHAYVGTAAGQRWLDIWKYKQLGAAKFDRLTIRANTVRKKDLDKDLIHVKSLLRPYDTQQTDSRNY